MKRRRSVVGLGDSLRAVVGRLGRKNAEGERTAQAGEAWLSVAGATVEAHTTGAHMRGDALIVFVDSPAWATELSAMSELYRTAINKEIGQDLVNEIRFTVSKRVADQHQIARKSSEDDGFYDEDKVESVALTPAELAQVEASTSAIQDEELRQTVLRATVKDLEWKKGIANHKTREGPRQGL